MGTLFAWIVLLFAITISKAQSIPPETKREANPDLYKSLLGIWGGGLHYDCNEFKTSCSANITFNHDHTLEVMFGPGCPPGGHCYSKSKITNITTDTITTSFSCIRKPGNPPPCFCTNNFPLEFCLKYTKPAVMSLKLALHLSPSDMYNTCPAKPELYCPTNKTNNIGLSQLTCEPGSACEVCNSQTTCNNRGKCNTNGKCNCFASFLGPSCNVSACGSECSNHGICDVTKTRMFNGVPIYDETIQGECKCFVGWYGKDCSSADIYAGRKKVWEALTFVVVVSLVAISISSFKRYNNINNNNDLFRRRSRFSRHRRRRRDVELDEFLNPL